MRRFCRTLVLFVVMQLTLFSFAVIAQGDMILIAGESAPRYGQVIKTRNGDDADENTVRFRERVGEDTEVLSIAKENVELLIVNIDERRLSRLTPEQLSDYRDYAESLASQKRDPVARELAIRLYLIAAANGFRRGTDRSVAQSAMVGLSALGRTERESRNFEVLRFIYDRRDHLPKSKPEDGEPVPAMTAIDKQAQQESLDKLLRALRMIRREDLAGAKPLLDLKEVHSELTRWNSVCSAADVREMMSTNRLSLGQLSKLLKLELAVQSGEVPPPVRESSDWAEPSTRVGQGWTQLPDFSTATEFDPQESIYREGKWVKPPQSGPK